MFKNSRNSAATNGRKALLLRVLVMLMAYLMIYYFGGAMRDLLYPIIWMVAFLHELGHALAAVMTGGMVESLLVNPDGSGMTTTRGGSTALILMGGYIGSALIGNLLFYIGVKHHRIAQGTMIGLASAMIWAGFFWGGSSQSSLLLFLFAAALILIAFKTTYDRDVLIFLGMASVLYIIQDINVGPSSDLAAYERHIGLVPASFWRIIWFAVVVIITVQNVRGLFRSRR